MDLSIIILNYKSSNLVKHQLKKLTNYNFSVDVELIVIDNNSNDNIKTVLENFPNVKFIESKENRGYGAGNNLAMRHAGGEYVLILNPDIRIEKDTIEKLYYKIRSDANIGIIGPRLINADESTQETSFSFPNILYPLFRRTSLGNTKIGKKWLDKFLLKHIDRKQNSKVDWLMGSCLMIKKSFFEELGGFDEKIFMYLEDMDLCRRIWEKGKQVYYMGEMSAIHLHQKMSADKNIIISIFTNKLSRIHIKSWIYYVKKYFNRPLKKN